LERTHDALTIDVGGDPVTGPEAGLLRCSSCGATWVSPAQGLLVRRHKPCLRCGAELSIEPALGKAPDENLGTVQRAWETLLSGDIDGFLDQHHPEAEIHPLATHLSEQVEPVYRGHARIRQWLEHHTQGCKASPNELQPFGDHVVTLGNLIQKGTPRAVAWVSQVSEGKIVCFKGYLNPAEALRELSPD
jgi:ketosteroid isomerase-like protein